MEKQNTNERANLLLEAAACRQVCKDLGRLVEKYQRAVEREAAARQEALAAALEYRSEREIQDAYGYDMLTERQYAQYLDLFRRGQEAMENPPETKHAVSLRISRKLLTEMERELYALEDLAMTPEQRAAAKAQASQARREWKERRQAMQIRRGQIEEDRGVN